MKEYWNREADAFDRIYDSDGRLRGFFNRLFRGDMAGRFRFTMRHALARPGPKILEVGCGTGVYSVGFLRGGASHVTGIDIAERMLSIARTRLEPFPERWRLIEGDFMALSLPRDFDVATAVGVFDYIPDPLPFLSKMMDRTRDIAIATFPRAGTWRAFVRRYRLALKGCPVYFYTKESVEALASGCGARVRHYERIGQLHCVVLSR